jgi:GDPmannose 4,6-dehydratase
VLATGETHTVREFAEQAFCEIGIELEWTGKEEKEKGIVKSINWDKARDLLKFNNTSGRYKYTFSDKLKSGDTVLVIDPNYYRPTEVDLLIGDPSKAQEKLGWKAKTKFEDLVSLMIRSDMDKVLMRGY